MAGKRFALLGERLGHSLSVPIYRAIFRLLGTEDDYRLAAVPRDRFPTEVPRLMAELDGFNITIPYKREIMPYLDRLDPGAALVGAVNTAVRTPDGWMGCNTDVAGFAAMLQAQGLKAEGQDCWILGTGGASAAVIAALEGLGARRITLVSRHPSGDAVGYDAFTEEAAGLLVNATPAGMQGQTDDCPLTPEQLRRVLPRLTGVADLIYNPPETVLIHAARVAGIPACNGLYMLVAQAVAAERLWQGREIPDEIIPGIMREVELK